MERRTKVKERASTKEVVVRKRAPISIQTASQIILMDQELPLLISIKYPKNPPRQDLKPTEESIDLQCHLRKQMPTTLAVVKEAVDSESEEENKYSNLEKKT